MLFLSIQQTQVEVVEIKALFTWQTPTTEILLGIIKADELMNWLHSLTRIWNSSEMVAIGFEAHCSNFEAHCSLQPVWQMLRCRHSAAQAVN